MSHYTLTVLLHYHVKHEFSKNNQNLYNTYAKNYFLKHFLLIFIQILTFIQFFMHF